MFPLLNASFSPNVEYQMEANNKGLLFFLKQKGTKMKFSTASFFFFYTKSWHFVGREGENSGIAFVSDLPVGTQASE